MASRVSVQSGALTGTPHPTAAKAQVEAGPAV